MERKRERQIVTIMGIWQIIDGLITILYYGLYKLGSTLATTSSTLNRSMFTLTCSFGILLITLGMVNLLLGKRYIKNGKIHYKIGFFLIFQALISYFMMDIISVILGMTAGVILLAKNKSIRLSAG